MFHPFTRKGLKYSPENYRPKSFTCICCKILEHVVVSAIMTHADKHNILYPLQHGFRKNRSCETQFLEFINDVAKNMANSVQTDVLIMDFSKAFDKVSHNLLTHKLNYYRIQGKTNTWMHNFLSNRTQTVLLEGETSDYILVNVWCAPRVCSGTKSVPFLHKQHSLRYSINCPIVCR